MKIQQLYVGSWFQRTTLHLSECYGFLTKGTSPLNLDSKKLEHLRSGLNLLNIEMKVGEFEHIDVRSENGISFKIYEDGLILLKKEPSADISEDIRQLTKFYEEKLSPALSYIFSLGAPIPKELANIKTIYPYFAVVERATPKDIDALFEHFKEKKYFEIKEKTFAAYRGDKLYIIDRHTEPLEYVERFVEEHIFIREFKGQMHRYLNLHRIIWERIAEVKERGEIAGENIGPFRNKIEGYSKAINLIEGRINQMGTYINTRRAIAHGDARLTSFMNTLEFKHETLADTLSYIKDIWGMTKNYVNSALDVFSELQSAATDNSIQNLTVVTSMGVGAALISLFTESQPDFTLFGFVYFLILVAVGYAANFVMKKINIARTYDIESVEADTHIQ